MPTRDDSLATRRGYLVLAGGTRIETAEPRLPVTEALVPGRYQFQLVVTDDAGNQSGPALAEVIVVARPGRGPARRLPQ